MDHTTFSPADIRLNNSVFQWHQRMPEVFDEHRKIINANRIQYENALKLRRERFVEELDGYAKQVEEFQVFGDMSEINRYLKKAQALQTRLETAAEKVNTLPLFVLINIRYNFRASVRFKLKTLSFFYP